MERLQFKIEDKFAQKIRELADKEDRPISNVVRRLIKKSIENGK